MSNNVTKYDKYARALNLSYEEFLELVNRQVGFLQNKEINTATVADSFFIAMDIIERVKKVEAEKWETSSKELREYGSDIERLRISGEGYGGVKKELSLKASPTSIANFCRKNNLEKGVKNG